ncbi:MAG: hypothetical protein COA70_08490 [Planctomycetota bacterium]|nr:MAG: hypothetical protein COA70_08490 [Planctomycetota bacterium]
MNEGLIPVGVFETAIEAHLALNLIESEGVEGHVSDESLSQLTWHFGKAMGGVKLYVWDSDFDEAMRILDIHRERSVAIKQESVGGVLKRSETPRGAARVALLAMIMPPLAFYSLYLACRVLFLIPNQGFTKREKTNLTFAFCLSSLIVGTAITILVKISSGK